MYLNMLYLVGALTSTIYHYPFLSLFLMCCWLSIGLLGIKTSCGAFKTMKKLIQTYLLFAGLQTFACDCIVNSDPNSYMRTVDMVFTGKVVELIKVETEEIPIPAFLDTIPGGREHWKAMNPDQYYARVLMIENIKGKKVRTDTLFFISEFTKCDPIYGLNQSYLFFADQTKDGKYMMVHCTPWGILKETEKTIKELKK